VVLEAAAAGRAGRALVGRQSRVRLHEVGPRLEMEIVKVSVVLFFVLHCLCVAPCVCCSTVAVGFGVEAVGSAGRVVIVKVRLR
jgi:hypothetical protein